MKVPPSCDLPVYTENEDINGFFRTLTRRLKTILEELAQAVNTNDTRAVADTGTGDGSVKMGNANNAENSGWIEIEEDKWIPYWNAPNP